MNWDRTTICCNNFEVRLRRSQRRRTVGITVRDGIATIAVPQQTPYSVAEKLVKSKLDWIGAKIKEQQQRLSAVRREYIDGEGFAYLGRIYRLQVVNELLTDDIASVMLFDSRLVVALNAGIDDRDGQRVVSRALISWYRENADSYLASRTWHYAALLRVTPIEIKVRDYKSRWGSCSPHGVISYNWRIIMADPAIVDYLVVHELCHLHHLDHSRKFWQLVEKHSPDYRRQRNWLRENGWKLAI